MRNPKHRHPNHRFKPPAVAFFDFLWQITEVWATWQEKCLDKIPLCWFFFIYKESKVGQLDSHVKWNQTFSDWYPGSSRSLLPHAVFPLDQEHLDILLDNKAFVSNSLPLELLFLLDYLQVIQSVWEFSVCLPLIKQMDQSIASIQKTLQDIINTSKNLSKYF